ncbi:hypothetical protein [Spiroplasma culicicola]|uniref:Lipoprotein n=1 Tax=Spiroplasma culicicola AES-1 TaxID=1276246 RepID=W6A871_9MOLU|nr:hypothetical protein [Spiroplasma culicicola]AHI53343.1 hypothetical protein SCULI_v1c10030 [Spiroplasma culicicola AES-1]
MKKLLVILTSINIICSPVMSFAVSCGTSYYYNLPNFNDIRPGDSGKIIKAKVWREIQSQGLNIEYSDYKLLIEKEGLTQELNDNTIIWYRDVLIIQILDKTKTPYNDKRVVINESRYSIESLNLSFKINQTKENIKTIVQTEMVNINNNIEYLNDYGIYVDDQNIEQLEDFALIEGQSIRITAINNSKYITNSKTIIVFESRIDISKMKVSLEMVDSYNEISKKLEQIFGNDWEQHLDIKIQREDLDIEFNLEYLALDDDIFTIEALFESERYFGKNINIIESKIFDNVIKDFLSIQAGLSVEEAKLIFIEKINIYFKQIGLIGDKYLVEKSDFDLDVYGLNISPEHDNQEYLGFNSNIYIRFNDDFKYLKTVSVIKPKAIELDSGWFSLEELKIGDDYNRIIEIINNQLYAKASFLSIEDIIIEVRDHEFNEDYIADLNDTFIILSNSNSKILSGGIITWQLS